MRNEMIKLITEYKEDNQRKTLEIDNICAEKLSIMMNEFYTSNASSFNLKYTFKIDKYEWESATLIIDGKEYIPTKLVNNGVNYNIVRTYNKKNLLYITVR